MKRRRGSKPGREEVPDESAIAGEISMAPENADQERDDAETSGPAGPAGRAPGHGEPKARARSKADPLVPGSHSNRDQARWTGDRAATGGNKTGTNKRRKSG